MGLQWVQEHESYFKNFDSRCKLKYNSLETGYIVDFNNIGILVTDITDHCQSVLVDVRLTKGQLLPLHGVSFAPVTEHASLM